MLQGVTQAAFGGNIEDILNDPAPGNNPEIQRFLNDPNPRLASAQQFIRTRLLERNVLRSTITRWTVECNRLEGEKRELERKLGENSLRLIEIQGQLDLARQELEMKKREYEEMKAKLENEILGLKNEIDKINRERARERDLLLDLQERNEALMSLSQELRNFRDVFDQLWTGEDKPPLFVGELFRPTFRRLSTFFGPDLSFEAYASFSRFSSLIIDRRDSVAHPPKPLSTKQDFIQALHKAKMEGMNDRDRDAYADLFCKLKEKIKRKVEEAEG